MKELINIKNKVSEDDGDLKSLKSICEQEGNNYVITNDNFKILIPIDKIIEIFLFMFLEKDVLFFSKNIELLTLTINAFLNLSFPLNDEKYYFINASVSLDNYINNNSPFVGATFTTLIGINSAYNQKYQKSS